MTAAVVTGMGAVTPSGLDVASLWDAVSCGRSAITVLAGPEFDALPVRIGGQVRGFHTDLERPLARRLSPVLHWAIAAADQALAQTGATVPASAHHSGEGADGDAGEASLPWEPHRVAVIVATGSGPVDAMQQATRRLDATGPRAVPLTLAVHGAPDAAAALISQRYGITGPAQGVSATCASGAVALGEGMRRIRHGYADAVLVVGMEDCLNAVNLASNANMRALAYGREGDPAGACRPFDRSRNGFVMSQGAAAILLESQDAARARGVRPFAELAGFGASSDAYHPTAPHPGGRGAAQAVRDAVTDAGLGTEPDPPAAPGPDAHLRPGVRRPVAGIEHINAHGTGTPAGDAAELAAFEAVFGARAGGIPISATKSSTGHLLGASGVVEAVIAVQTLTHRILPPTVNLDDPEFPDWNIVTAPTPADVDVVLSTSFGFGGHNAAIVLTRPD
ncbi:beta-ketoacyl-[acyl-carrier-protein] synthase family protein [Microbacterium luticocti]|uniref:beta-ketoacyl-[acyl-carrier-protein] synthase family protein n=1 Tax=Microbacterium luticocti TaxID=451764 RepID=UPI000400F5EA|nr:beta-ketoacyl-[acyl-carrier-protein] synthase family protein [Microbacterium luticocti]